MNVTADQAPDRSEVARRVLARRFPRGRIERVLLINPPEGDADLFNVATAKRGRYHNYPPYGLTVLGAHLRGLGIGVRILNLNHEMLVAASACETEDAFDFDGTWQRLVDRTVAEFPPDLIGVTCMF